MPILAIGISKNGKNLTYKNIAKKRLQNVWKTVIFGNICQIWQHHLTTLPAAAGCETC